jgi:hypothetical protein
MARALGALTLAFFQRRGPSGPLPFLNNFHLVFCVFMGAPTNKPVLPLPAAVISGN